MKGIITSDWHLRDDRPICRLDNDWYETQRNNIRFVVNKANELDCDIYIIGDLFNKPIVSPFLMNLFLREIHLLKNNCYILIGNHDVQYGNIDNFDNSSIGILFNSGCQKIKVLNDSVYKRHRFLHTLIYNSKKEIPVNCKAITAKRLIKENDDCDYIFTGDNHKSFIYEYEGCLLINSGCLIRQDANEIDYVPKIYYVNTEEDNWTSIESLDNSFNEFMTDNHLKKIKERDCRIHSFVEKIKDSSIITLDFESNLKRALKEEKLKIETQEIIEGLLIECT